MHDTACIVAAALCGMASASAQVSLLDPLAPFFDDPPPAAGAGINSHMVRSATSDDGLSWIVDEGIRLESASVPCAINDGDKRVLIYFVKPPDGRTTHTENTACAVSEDGIHFTIANDFKIEGMKTMKACDPGIIRDDEGRFRLYYFASDFHGDPAIAPGAHTISLAVSNDGIHYREFGETISREELCDPDVFRVGKEWFMFVHGQAGTVIARSEDGLKFRYHGVLPLQGWATTMPVPLGDGRLRLYAFEQKPGSNIVGSFISTDGLSWTQEPGARLTAEAGMQITDPFVIRWSGKWKMYFKTHATPQPPAGRDSSRGFANANAPQPFNQQPQRPMQQAQQNGPWNNDVLIYRATADGKQEKLGTFDRAGVPTIARMKDGRLIAAYQHFPSDDERHFDRVAVSFSENEGRTWTKGTPIEVEALDPSLARPFDPTLVPVPDGRIRLYFTSNHKADFRTSTPQIYSAISSDGIHYTFEPGVRFGLEGRIVIDCAVVLHQGVFHLYSPDNGTANEFQNNQDNRAPPRARTAYHAKSTDGVNFTRVDDVTLEDRDLRWLGNAQSDGKTITFFATGRGVFTATSTDGSSWTPSTHYRLAGADPGGVAVRGGGWLIVVTGPPRDQWADEWAEEARVFDLLK